MFRNQESPLSEAQLKGVYMGQIRGSGELRMYVGHYLSCPEDHTDRP